MAAATDDPGLPNDVIRVRGAREHNLDNVDLDLPLGRLIVVTGPSGSGKSSLAFDTLHAEGQRQYIESLSVQVRHHLSQLQRPDVDSVEGLPPTVCIDQRIGNANRRSTVATVTEIWDYLRLLMARLGTPHCFQCGCEIRQHSPEKIEERLAAMPGGTKIIILAPMVRGKPGTHSDVFARIRKAGFVRARIDGDIHDLDQLPTLVARQDHQIDAVVDRVIVRAGSEARIAESLRLALHHGDGILMTSYLSPDQPANSQSDGAWKNETFNSRFTCSSCDASFEELEPRTFSFNSPYGACPTCEGLGSTLEFNPCQACAGSRLRPEARSVTIRDKAIHEIAAFNVDEACDFFQRVELNAVEGPIGRPLITEILKRLRFLSEVGVSYLTLDRPSDTLSGGEFQRVRLAGGIGSGLVGVCYILDEPSIGLHPCDNQRLIGSLRRLQEQGNTVLVVEHDEATMRAADLIIDMGPGAGRAGGRIVCQGTPAEIAANPNSPTGQFLARVQSVVRPNVGRPIVPARSIVLEGATHHNLKNIDVRIPLGVFVCVTGVSGSGKSSLVNETLAPAIAQNLLTGPVSKDDKRLKETGTSGKKPDGRETTSVKPGSHKRVCGVEQIDKLVEIDQAPLGRSARSNAATFTGVFDEIRRVFAATRLAKQYGFGAGRFSFNAKGGRCEACAGHGVQKLEMDFLPDLFVVCDECRGARFNQQTLRVKFRGRSIANVLEMNVDEAVSFFENFSRIHRVLETLREVGLAYLPLGQPSTTLSGGEAQRVKLAFELARVDTGKTMYLLDEPTSGLHFVDIQRLLSVLHRLVDQGNSVIVIEHNLDVIRSADWIIDLGPEGGSAGGYLVAEGTPEDIAANDDSHTGRAIRDSTSK